MPCCIEQCPPGMFPLVKFPPARLIRSRWRDAIKAGTGTVPAALRDLAVANADKLQICSGHFPHPYNGGGYQDPTVFINRLGERVTLDCCRMCDRFEPASQMYPLRGTFCGQSLHEAVLRTVKICLKPDEDPWLLSICRECLVKLDLVRVIQNEFLMMVAQHGKILRMQTPLEMVAPAKPLDGFMVMIEDIKKEVEEACSVQEDGSEVAPNVAIVKDEPIEVVTIKEEVVDEPQEETDNQKALKYTPESATAMSSYVGQPMPDVNPQKRPVVESDVEAKVQKISPSSAFPLRALASKTCYICPIELTDVDHLLAHLTEKHAGKVDYICPHCDGKQLLTVQAYNEHLSFHDSTIRPLQCSFCSLRYCTRKAVEMHEMQAHGAPHKHPLQKTKPLRNVPCEQCDKKFYSKAAAAEHKRVIHDNEKAVECKICHKKLGYRNSLPRHMLIHTGEKPYECETCGLRFKIITDMKKHIEGEHQGKMPYYCKKCKIPLKDKSAYYRHRDQHKLQMKDPLNRLWKCALCPTVSTVSQDLQAHIDEHHPTEDYPYTPCPVCPQKFLSPSLMQTHKYFSHLDQRTPRANKLECAICNELQKSQDHMETHMVRVHEMEKQYVCKLCNSRFTNRANLYRHQNLHKAGKKFACDLCDKSFHQKGAMENHRRSIHTGEKPFQCQVCGKRFKETSTYYRHRATCGLGEPREATSQEPRDATLEEPREQPREATMEEPREVTLQEPREATWQEPRDAALEDHREASLEELQEAPRRELLEEPWVEPKKEPWEEPMEQDGQ